MLIHITFMGVYCIYVYMYIFTIMTTMWMYIYVDYSSEIIVFPLCTAKCGQRVIKFVFVFVFVFVFTHFGMKEYTSLPDVVSEEIDNVDLNCLYD